MHAWTRRSLLLAAWLCLDACGAARKPEQPPDRVVAPPPPARGLYAAEEALRDVLAGPLEYIGTGPWPGNGRMHACAFRNQRVIVVNAYCGIRDTPAFRLEVFSPTRGRVRIYAESKAPVSERVRQQYFTFMAETEPPAGPPAAVPPLDLRMSLAQLYAYEERRYAAYLPACYGGIERQRPKSGCLGPLASEAAAWTARHQPFLERANDDWYRVVRDLRALAARYGRDPD